MSDKYIEPLRAAGQRLRFARAAANHVRDEAKQLVLEAVGDGMAESRAADLVGVDRMTVRSWRGK